MTIAAAPSGALVVASVMQRTSDEETFYTMTAIANRRPLQVVRCQPLIKAFFICSFRQVSPLATQAAFMADDVAKTEMSFASASSPGTAATFVCVVFQFFSHNIHILTFILPQHKPWAASLFFTSRTLVPQGPLKLTEYWPHTTQTFLL